MDAEKIKLIKELDRELRSYTKRRLVVRSVDVSTAVLYAASQAEKLNRPIVVVRHGGSVRNAYNYPAVTEGIVVVALPDGCVFGAVCRLPANKVTRSGVVANACGNQYRAVVDPRFSAEKAKLARAALIKEMIGE